MAQENIIIAIIPSSLEQPSLLLIVTWNHHMPRKAFNKKSKILQLDVSKTLRESPEIIFHTLTNWKIRLANVSERI